MGKKNLDKLFQQKLKDFSETPDTKVWQSIEASLDQKKKSRKVIPFWWKLGGVAATLLLGLFLWRSFENDTLETPAVTEVEKTAEENEENKTLPSFEKQNSSQDQVVETEQKTSLDSINNTSTPQETSVASSSQEAPKTNTISTSSASDLIKEKNSDGIQIANTTKSSPSTTQKEGIPAKNEFDTSNKETEVAQTTTSPEIEKNSSNEGRYANSLSKQLESPKKEVIAQVEEKTEKTPNDVAKKKSIFEVIEAQEEDETIAENTGSRWSAGPSVAPVYSSAIGEGSPVHSIFVPNSKSGDVNLSYGLSVAYELNKKLSVRSGIHRVNYGYSTNDVEFSASLANGTAGQLDNIDYASSSKNVVVSSKANSASIENFSDNPFITASSDVSAASAIRNGVMDQQFGYLEVPLELNYALVDRKFGINVIGGLSSLFLIDNTISLSSGDLTTEVGEANNINSVNFSANAGFGLNYKFTPKMQFNIEPVFKYQLNTFSDIDGTFNPFSVGVYSGLSFKF